MSIWRIRTVWTGVQGTPFLSTHYFNSLLTSAVSAAEAVDAFWTACASSIVDNALFSIETDVAELDQVTGDVLGVTAIGALGGSGLAAGEQMSAATQGLIRWRTGQYANGREIRGRTFVPGVVEGGGAEFPNSTYTADLLSAAQGLVAAEGFSVWSKKNGLAPGVTSASVWGQWAVLRSRRD